MFFLIDEEHKMNKHGLFKARLKKQRNGWHGTCHYCGPVADHRTWYVAYMTTRVHMKMLHDHRC